MMVYTKSNESILSLFLHRQIVSKSFDYVDLHIEQAVYANYSLVIIACCSDPIDLEMKTSFRHRIRKKKNQTTYKNTALRLLLSIFKLTNSVD